VKSPLILSEESSTDTHLVFWNRSFLTVADDVSSSLRCIFLQYTEIVIFVDVCIHDEHSAYMVKDEIGKIDLDNFLTYFALILTTSLYEHVYKDNKITSTPISNVNF
jgi:hypothetical protein